VSKRYLIYLSGVVAILLILGALGLWYLAGSNPERTSPYVSQLDSPVRGLSRQEVDDLLNGRGAGYARSAELNGYPGPRHVLDMREELTLSPQVVAQLEAIFSHMENRARQLGQQIVHQETELSQKFADNTLSETEMEAQVKELALLYGELRATHLQAHFQTLPLLSLEQVSKYNILRGYTNTLDQASPSDHHQMSH
jgi:Spy/CpxP family protein refolding chaperone